MSIPRKTIQNNPSQPRRLNFPTFFFIFFFINIIFLYIIIIIIFLYIIIIYYYYYFIIIIIILLFFLNDDLNIKFRIIQTEVRKNRMSHEARVKHLKFQQYY